MIRPLLSSGQKIRAILCFAGLVTIGYFYYTYLLNPALISLEGVRHSLEEIEKKPVKREMSQSSVALKEEISELQNRKKALDKDFAKEKNIRLTQIVNSLGQQQGVDLRKSLKINQQEQGNFIKANVTLTAVGKYENIRNFLSDLAAKGCIIRTADMAVNSENRDSLKLSLSFVYYRYNK